MKKRVKHIPQRTCIGCRQVLPKKSLIRIVRSTEGVKIDLSGKMNGRGVYLHESSSCWERGINGAIAHALKVELTQQEKHELSIFLETIKNKENATEEVHPASS
jgi:hypothetical protein